MMKMSTRARYGLRAMVDLAARGAWRGASGRTVPLSLIGRSQGIPEQYLRQIFLALKRGGLVEAVMGKDGGYRLVRPPVRISAYDVVRALGEAIVPVPCVRNRSVCCRVKRCPTHDLWCRVALLMKTAMVSTTVAQLAVHCPLRGRARRKADPLFPGASS
jgi:Rrf2 family protein